MRGKKCPLGRFSFEKRAIYLKWYCTQRTVYTPMFECVVELIMCKKGSNTSDHKYVRTLSASTQKQTIWIDTRQRCVCVYVHIHSSCIRYENTSVRLYVRFSLFPNEHSAVRFSVKWMWTSFELIYDWVAALVIEVKKIVAHT